MGALSIRQPQQSFPITLLPHNLHRFTEHSHGHADAGLDPELPVQPSKLSPQRVVTNSELVSNCTILQLITDAADDRDPAI